MNVLLVGSGAREHAIAWKLRQSPRLTDLFVAPGNAGTAALATNLPLNAADLEGLAGASRENRCQLVIVGRLGGREVSAHAFSDGRTTAAMPFSCDYKRALDGDEGLNTGGMGAYSPPARLDAATASPLD